MTQKLTDELAESWHRGSIEYFRQDWMRQEKLPSLIYPRKSARSQWDAFECLKAATFLEQLRASVPIGGRVLEYGCGSAGILVYLTNHGYRGTALDATEQALRLARRNDAAEGAASRQHPTGFVQADALRMPFPDATFDCVVSNGLLEHFAPSVVPGLLAEVIRVLKPGGLFLADIAHRRASTRQVAKPFNFGVSYAAQIWRERRFAMSHLWRTVSSPMYENNFDRHRWRRALSAAGLADVAVLGFRLPPPLSLPQFLDRWYAHLLLHLPPLRWSASVHPYHVPFGWLYLASGRKAGVNP